VRARILCVGLALIGLCVVHSSSGTAQEKLPEPGAEHKLLARLEGTWTAKVKSWLEPGKPPEESSGTMVRKMILDGRYREERYNGTVLGKPFKGLGIFGYDLELKKYFMSWIDNLGTGLMVSYGTYDPQTKSWSYLSEEEGPQGKLKIRDVLRMISDNELRFEMYRTPPDNKEIKIMEITYTRKK
jgi:hypothetical protein